jgi:hypothetical protein
MAMNANVLRRLSDRRLFLAAAIMFPLLVLVGYFKSYYFSGFFPDARPIANALVHFHGIVMSLWVAYFVVQVTLIRSKNVKLHMTLGFAGIALAALVVAVGLATAYDAQLVRGSAPPGVDPRSFFILPVGDMALFVLFFAGAVYYRKRPAEHKTLMLMTAINFLPAAFFRVPLVPVEYVTWWAFGLANIIALTCFAWYTFKHRKLNKAFLASVMIFVALTPLRVVFARTEIWLGMTDWLSGK